MPDFPFAIVLFDLDGTLVDSSLDLGPALNHALALEDRAPLPLAEVRQVIGGGAVQMLEAGLEHSGGPVSPDRFRELKKALLNHYWAHIADNTCLFPGVASALDLLAAKGCKLAVCTNKFEEPARQLIEALGITDRFCAIHGGDTFGRGKAKPEPDMLLAAIEDCGGGRAAMVGDSTYDVRAARNADCPVVTYRYGYHDVPMDELGGDVMIDHFDELVGALEGL